MKLSEPGCIDGNTRTAHMAPEPLVAAKSMVAAYRKMAPVYDLLFGLSLEPGRRSAARALDVATGDRVLEVGVGTGLSLPHWRTDVAVTGIDLCPQMPDELKSFAIDGA